MTKASLTDRQAITSTPLPLMSPASCLKPGRCLAEQVGVKAPGRANSATFLPATNSSVVTGFGPSAVASVRVTLGSLSPTLIVMGPFLRLQPAHSVTSAHRKPAIVNALESVMFKGKCRGDGRRILLRPAL